MLSKIYLHFHKNFEKWSKSTKDIILIFSHIQSSRFLNFSSENFENYQNIKISYFRNLKMSHCLKFSKRKSRELRKMSTCHIFDKIAYRKSEIVFMRKGRKSHFSCSVITLGSFHKMTGSSLHYPNVIACNPGGKSMLANWEKC